MTDRGSESAMQITHDVLIKAGMPPWDVNKFRALWPDGCEITGENIQLASKNGLDAEVLFAAIATPAAYAAWRDSRPPWSFLQAEIKEAEARLAELRREEPIIRDRVHAEHLAKAIIAALKGAGDAKV